MLLKKFLLAIAGVALLSTGAMAESVTAPGKVAYIMPSGELVKRDISIEVPARGEGDLFMLAGGQKIKAHAFKTIKANNRTIFAVLFINPPGAPENTAAVYYGTYMRGTNEAIYYGDIYSKTFDGNSQQSENDLLEHWDDVTHDVKHIGGFYFSAPVPATPAPAPAE